MAPDDAEIHYNLGNAHLAAADWAAAEAALARAVALDPHHVRARTNLGTALKEQGRLDAAIAALRAAVACAPDDAEAHWNLALALLKAGHYADGWRLYEWRRRLPGFAMRRFDLPAWDGGPLAGRRLVVHAEQGLGDTVQFARYLGDVDPRDGGVVVQVPQTLAPLLAGLRGSAAALRLVGADESLPRCDVEAPLMSLPRLLARPAPFWPATGPYLAAEPDRSARWRDRLAGHDGPTVAICWQGSADYRADARRSIPLRHFAPLAGLERVRLVSLQKGPGRDQRAAQPWRQRLLDLDAEIDRDGAFRDTAAILGCVDLLVTSDTSVAHVAGALGVETWMALADVPDWRWGLEGERTPWYPSLRLFRQSRPGDWDGVFAAIARALAERSR